MRFSRFLLCAPLCFIGAATGVARAQTQPTAPASTAATAYPLPILDLSREAALRVPVTFEARQQPLVELLAALQKQSGLALSAPDQNAIAAFKVTVHVEAMPLAHIMAALARLYRFEWRKDGAGYALVVPPGAELERALGQLGAPENIEEQAKLQSWRERRGVNWLEQVAPFASEAALRAPDGVALSAASPALQERLRHPIELPAAARLAQAYAKAAPDQLETGRVRISVSPSNRAAASTKVTLLDSANKHIVPVIALTPNAGVAP